MWIEGKLGVLSNQPGIGAARLPGFPDVRAFPVGSHLLFYRPHSGGGGIELIRVMHALGSGPINGIPILVEM